MRESEGVALTDSRVALRSRAPHKKGGSEQVPSGINVSRDPTAFGRERPHDYDYIGEGCRQSIRSDSARDLAMNKIASGSSSAEQT